MYAFRKRSAVNYNDLDNGRLAIVHSSPSPVRLPRRQNICKNERDLLNYLIVDALTKKRLAQMQSISIPICQRVEGQLVEIFGVKRSFCQNEALSKNFDLQTVVAQRNKQQLLDVTYSKSADQLEFRLRKKKQLSFEKQSGSTVYLDGITYLVARFMVVQSVAENSN